MVVASAVWSVALSGDLLVATLAGWSGAQRAVDLAELLAVYSVACSAASSAVLWDESWAASWVG